MFKAIKMFFFLSMIFLDALPGLNGLEKVYDSYDKISEKMYIDNDEFNANTKGDAFHIHIGNNVWLVTNSVHRDSTGIFAYECNLSKTLTGLAMEYERKWKCPYCYNYWPIGKPCGNKDCPSKYKE